jgi:hypothetical protein
VVDDYDFRASLVHVRSATAPSRPVGRKLPVLAGITNGSYGR